MVERFGPGIVAADGTLDRPAVARSCSPTSRRRKDLEAIVHPAVGAEMLNRMQAVADTDRVVIYDVPLLVESARRGYGAVIVVDVDPEVAVRRLVEQRQMDDATREPHREPGQPRGAAGRRRPGHRQLGNDR